MEVTAKEVKRPYKKWVLVQADPRVKKTAGGIHLPNQLTGIERVMEGTGKVLKTGSEVHEVEPGQRVVYRGFLKDVNKDLFIKIDGCDVFLIRIEDILAVIGPGVTMGEFSGSVQA